MNLSANVKLTIANFEIFCNISFTLSGYVVGSYLMTKISGVYYPAEVSGLG